MVYDSHLDLSHIKKILVIKMRHLGDVLLCTPTLTSLKEVLPQAEIDVLVNQESEQLLSGHSSIRKLHLYDRSIKKKGIIKRILYEIKLLLKIRKENYQLTINLTEGDRGILTSLVTGARIRVGFEPEPSFLSWKVRLLTHPVKKCPTPRHNVERDLDTLRCLGIVPQSKELTFTIPKIAEQCVEDVLQKRGVSRYILLQSTSRWHFKSPPAEKLRELVEALLKRGDKVVVTSGPDPFEREFVKKIIKGLDPESIIDVAGVFSLKEFAVLIKRAAALITVDSLALHLASTLKVPTVALFGPTCETTWGPWNNPQAYVVAEPFSCRPCNLAGCGGSRKSDCLQQLSIIKILRALDIIERR